MNFIMDGKGTKQKIRYKKEASGMTEVRATGLTLMIGIIFLLSVSGLGSDKWWNLAKEMQRNVC